MDRMDDQLSFLCYSNQMVNETMYFPYQNIARQFREMEAQGIPVTIANLAIHRHREEEMNQERVRHNQTVQEATTERAREASKGKAREVVPDSEEEESEELHSSASEECTKFQVKSGTNSDEIWKDSSDHGWRDWGRRTRGNRLWGEDYGKSNDGGLIKEYAMGMDCLASDPMTHKNLIFKNAMETAKIGPTKNKTRPSPFGTEESCVDHVCSCPGLDLAREPVNVTEAVSGGRGAEEQNDENSCLIIEETHLDEHRSGAVCGIIAASVDGDGSNYVLHSFGGGVGGRSNTGNVVDGCGLNESSDFLSDRGVPLLVEPRGAG
ncbi:hypothetical protein PIB30_063453, partial [Stylosanthes scabra]|nr:hypothetical protein [Stylosanthes scabra]